jgi:hypothetical protein
MNGTDSTPISMLFRSGGVGLMPLNFEDPSDRSRLFLFARGHSASPNSADTPESGQLDTAQVQQERVDSGSGFTAS